MFKKRRQTGLENPLPANSVANPLHHTLPQRQLTVYDLSQQSQHAQSLVQPAPSLANELLPSHDKAVGVSLTKQSKRVCFEWFFPLAVLVILPCMLSTIIISIVVFAGNSFISGSANGHLIYLSANDTSSDIWLGLSGYCFGKTCTSSPLNSFYAPLYNASARQLGSLVKVMPSDYSTAASLLLTCLIFLIITTVLLLWACFDYRSAEIWERQHRQQWVREYLVSRRLDLLGCSFGLVGLVSGVAASTSLTASSEATCSTVNALIPSLTDTSYTSCQRGSILTVLWIALALATFSIVLQLLLLAQDGLSRKLRLEYESMVWDLDAFAKDDFVVVQTQLNKMAEVRNELIAAPVEMKEELRMALQACIMSADIPTMLLRQERLLQAQRYEFHLISSQSHAASVAAGIPYAHTPGVPHQSFIPSLIPRWNHEER